MAAVVLFLLLGGTVVVGALARRAAWVLAVAVLGALWVVVNRPLEGPVLWVVAPGHGLTAADLLSPGCVALAAAGLGIRRALPLARRGHPEDS